MPRTAFALVAPYSRGLAELELIAILHSGLVLILRFIEGMVIGLKLAPKVRLWHVPSFIGMIILASLGLNYAHGTLVLLLTFAWAVFGSVVAAIATTTELTNSGYPYSDPFIRAAFVALLLAATLFISTSELMLHQLLLPAGFLAALLSHHLPNRPGAT